MKVRNGTSVQLRKEQGVGDREGESAPDHSELSKAGVAPGGAGFVCLHLVGERRLALGEMPSSYTSGLESWKLRRGGSLRGAEGGALGC